MNQVVCYVQMQVIRILVDSAQALMLFQAKGFSHDVLNPLKSFRRQPGFVFGPETHHQMIGLVTLATGVQRLGCFNLHKGQVIVRRKAALMPCHQALFTLMAGIANVVAKIVAAVLSPVSLGILSSVNALSYHSITASSCILNDFPCLVNPLHLFFSISLQPLPKFPRLIGVIP